MLISNFCTIALLTHHIQNDRMMNHPINRCQGGHRIFENALPFGKDRIASRKNLTLREENASWEILLSRRFQTR